MNKRIGLISSLTAVTLIFAGCGGGGGSSSNTALEETVSVTGKAADGYLVGAKVCLDKNSDGICNAGEPYNVTDTNGTYLINGILPADLTLYPLVAEVNSTTIDLDNGLPVGKSYTLSTSIGETFISPITTMAERYRKTNDVTKEQAKLAIANLLGTTNNELIFGDYIAANTIEGDKVHQSAQIIAGMKTKLSEDINTTIGSTQFTNLDQRAIGKYIEDKIVSELTTIKTSLLNNSSSSITQHINNIMNDVNRTNMATELTSLDNLFKGVTPPPSSENNDSALNTNVVYLSNTGGINESVINFNQMYRYSNNGSSYKTLKLPSISGKTCHLYIANTSSYAFKSDIYNGIFPRAYLVSGATNVATGNVSKYLVTSTYVSLNLNIATNESYLDFYIKCP